MKDSENSNGKPGARHFVDLENVVFFDDFADHLETLDGAEITDFFVDGTIIMRLEFTFRNCRFRVENTTGDYRFYVENADCAEETLHEVIKHFQKLAEGK